MYVSVYSPASLLTEVRPFIETWSEADCANFEKGFAIYNKNFFLIQRNRVPAFKKTCS